MTPDTDFKLKCLELAFTQARLEGFQGDRNKIAEIHTWIYNRCIEDPQPAAPDGAAPKAKADKAPEIFK